MNRKLMKFAIGMAAAAAALGLTACGNRFKASSEMTGSAPVAESVENLEKMDEKKTEAFLTALNKKYDVEVKDYTVDLHTEGAVDLELDELLGNDNDAAISIRLDGGVSGDQAGNMKLSDFDMDLGIPVLGDLSLKCDSYTDKAAKETYTMMKEFDAKNGLFDLFGTESLKEDLNKWTKSEIKDEGKEAAEDHPLKLTLDPEDVNGIYQDKNTEAYIVDLKMDGFNKLQDSVKIKDPGNGKVYVTYDKGLALCGIYAAADGVTLEAELPKEAAADADGPTELKLQNFILRSDFKALNSGADLSVPEDVKAAAVEGNKEDASELLSGISDMLS